MALKHFMYRRKVNERKLDSEGNVIPILDTEGNPTGKFEMEEVTLKDHMDLTRVIRTHAINRRSVVVLLDDGHEITDKIPVLKPGRKGKKNIGPDDVMEEKARVWQQSEIQLFDEDVDRYFERLEMLPD